MVKKMIFKYSRQWRKIEIYISWGTFIHNDEALVSSRVGSYELIQNEP